MLRPTLTFLSLALACGAVLAQTSSPTTTPSPTAQTGIAPAQLTPAEPAEFDDLDRNRDGFVARDEVPVTHDISRAWTLLEQRHPWRSIPRSSGHADSGGSCRRGGR